MYAEVKVNPGNLF